MVVGILRLTLAIPAAQSLKEKRHAVKKLVDRVRARFNASIAEVAENDVWQRAVLGVACVANERAFVNEQLDKIVHEIERAAVADVVNREMEIQSLKDLY